MFLECLWVGARWCVFMISMHWVSGVCVVCGLFVFFSSGVCQCRFGWTRFEFGVSMVCAWGELCVGVPINVVSVWYACGRCLMCVVIMVCVWCLFGVGTACFWVG